MYQLVHDIVFDNNGQKFKLKLLNEVKIKHSVENLVDTASIVLPESVMNNVLHLEEKINRGTKVSIKLGYDKKFQEEFTGFIKEINNNNGTLNIECEDALYLFHVSVPNKQFKPAPVKDVLQYLIDNVDSSFKLVMDADYGITYEKYTIYNAEAYDVLKKIQSELKANIYFDTSNKELHFHAPYKQSKGKVTYDLSQNVESSKLEYKTQINNKIEVVIQSTMTDGTIKEVSVGTQGGKKITMKVGAMSEGDMKKLAQNVFDEQNSDRYEGTIDTWLIPFCEPTVSARLIDPDAGNLELPDVRLRATLNDGDDQLLITPKKGSKALLISMDGTLNDLALFKIDQVDKIEYKQDDFEFTLDSQSKKVTLKNNNVSLKSLMKELHDIISNLKVNTPAGPSVGILPDSQTALQQFNTHFNNLLN